MKIVAVSMVSVTTGLAAVVCVSPGPVRKAILGNSVTRHPRTVAQAVCPSTATRMLSAASMTQQGASAWMDMKVTGFPASPLTCAVSQKKEAVHRTPYAPVQAPAPPPASATRAGLGMGRPVWL